MQILKISENDDMVTVRTKMFFDDVLYANGDNVKLKRKDFLATFQRRTDIPINPHFSVTKIQCPSCGGSFNAVQNKICPYCGNAYDIALDDWVLSELKEV